MSADDDDEAPDLPGLAYLKRLGAGGYANVFLYQQAAPRMPVAVKVLSGDVTSVTARNQFAAEGDAMAALSGHPNIVQVFRTDVTPDGRPYMVMMYYPGRNLSQRAKQEVISVPEILRIGVRIGCAVETAHRAGILHRDIKPANILTSQYSEPGLTDFGIASSSDTVGEAEGVSIPWAAPEVVFGTSQGDRRSDVYALGATLWHLLARRSPFELTGGDNGTAALMRRIRTEAVPKTGRPDVPGSLERVLAQAMAKDPEDRPRTALDLARNLQAVESEQGWAATPLVLLEEEAPVARDLHDEADRTRLRSGQVVVAQPAPIPPGPSPTTNAPRSADTGGVTLHRAAGPPPTRARQGMPGAPDDAGTVARRPVVVSAAREADDVPAIQGDPPTNPGRSRVVLGVVSVVVVATVVGVGAVLATSGGSHSARSSASSSTSQVTVALPVAAEAPQVTARSLAGGRVEFSWVNPDPQPGDTYVWSEIPQTAQHQTSATSVTLRAPACVQVSLDRDDQLAAAAPRCES